MDTERRKSYLKRLFTPYRKGGKIHLFVMQFLGGDGNELKKKFWSKRSSSRMAFELYSGLKDNDDIKELFFEYPLPGLASGGKGPNMDVYIETENDIIFIESKFKEKANLKYIKEGYLSKAYYSEEPYGERGMGLDERFYGNKWANRFARFCRDWEDIRNSNSWGEEYEWFEPKQETCHLSGILLFLFDTDNAERIKGKGIHLYNIYWKLGEKDGTPEMSQQFEDLANSFLTEILEEYGSKLGITDLDTGTYTVEDIRTTPELLSPDIHSLGTDLDLRLKEYDDLVIGQTRESLNK